MFFNKGSTQSISSGLVASDPYADSRAAPTAKTALTGATHGYSKSLS